MGPPQQLRLRSTLAVPLCTLAVALYGTESTTELSPTNAGPSTISRSPEESRLRQQSQSPASSRSRRKQGMQGQQSVTGRRTVCDVRAATYGQGSVDGVCQVDLPSANSNSTEPCTVAQPNFVPKQHNDSGSNGPLQDERWAKRCASSAPGASTRVRTRGMHARCTSKPTGGCMRHSAGLVRQWMWATQGLHNGYPNRDRVLYVACCSGLHRILQQEVACCACCTDLVDKERLVRNMIELEEDVACIRSAHSSHGSTQDWGRW
jgi:hypothetical protein